MAAEPAPGQPPGAPPKIHRALATRGTNGAVFKGDEITEADAIDVRRSGLDIVVCGDDRRANRALAKRIEDAVGPSFAETPTRLPAPRPCRTFIN